MSKLFIDDVRTAPSGWEVARTVKDAIARLEAERFDEISLDYVIGEAEGTFEPVALFLLSQPRERRPRRVLIHTSSSSGAERLRLILMGEVEEVVRV